MLDVPPIVNKNAFKHNPTDISNKYIFLYMIETIKTFFYIERNFFF